MDLVDAENVAMILDKKPSLVPAASRQTGYPRYLRIDADCRTVVRGTMTNDGNSFLTPRFEIYPITEEEPWATIEPLSASLAPYLGSFVDIRFVGKNEIISLDTSSRYLPLNYDCWNTMKQSNDNIKSNVQATSTTAPSKHMHTSKGDNMALNLHNITNISQLPVEILELILEHCDLGSLDSVMMRSKNDRILDVAMDRRNACVYFRKLTSRPKDLMGFMMESDVYLHGDRAAAYFYPDVNCESSPWKFACSSKKSMNLFYNRLMKMGMELHGRHAAV
ncbi:hypothetical protein ACMFMF_011900 [Clarireedia jacksonii]